MTNRFEGANALDPYADVPPPGEFASVHELAEKVEQHLAERLIDGAAFLLDLPDEAPAVWGRGNEVLWPEGEALMITGGNGVGKTTLAAQVVRARLGLADTVLEMPFTAGRRVLYLAMDRPAQIARALRRAFHPEEREVLAERLTFWKGPPEADMAQQPYRLAQLCQAAEADTVIVDSLKDAAIGLSSDEVGAGWNRARQTALTAGVQVLELHHMTKRDANGSPPKSIADVYGSAWLTSGAGSVMHLHGNPGDPVVHMIHLKPSMDEVGPYGIVHDHEHAVSTVQGSVDPLDLLRAHHNGFSAKQLAEALFDAESPNASQVEKARRKLDKLTRTGHAEKVDMTPPNPALYFATNGPACTGCGERMRHDDGSGYHAWCDPKAPP